MKAYQFSFGLEATIVSKTIGLPIEKTGVKIGDIVTLVRIRENTPVVMVRGKNIDGLLSFHLDDLVVG